MASYDYTTEQFVQAFLNLLPSGAVWPKERDSNMTAAVAAMMPMFERLHQRTNDTFNETFPATTAELLSEWEASLGLPDPCQGDAPSVESRRAQVLARFANTGGQSLSHLTRYAKNLGYNISITEYAPFRCEESAVEEPIYDDDVAYLLTVNAPLDNLREFEVENSAVEDPLRSWGNEVLECELIRIKPAHCNIVFSYTPPPSPNVAPNPEAAGAALGTTFPTQWTRHSAMSIVGIGYEGGLPYIDVRWNIPGAVTGASLVFGAPTYNPVTPGEVWSGGLFVKLISGSIPSATGEVMSIRLRQTNSSVQFANTSDTQITPTSAPLLAQRWVKEGAVMGGTSAYLNLNLTVNTTAARDFTLRIAWPQLERGATLSSVI
ncbi:DUF2313 domain-containing protein [Siccirubricoccus sp. KC 17139]|uniref:DUF2313 domain-containing protein n=1 Tax=Siccirubricoccus soli TaxID=2899147 RepID=A0ABT1D1B1_9PROT|nr:putative phage tail protein [Siccirubricoccus soli]MCO6414825.1 DUF2313 domain-containing protein [Siccirubricoccus soli]MCP2680955.1 DUF2313 domain-containing protein [Siccirubricoccus soli]